MTYPDQDPEAAALKPYFDTLRDMRLSLRPPPLRLAASGQILRQARRRPAIPSLIRVTGGWIALMILAVTMAGVVAYVAPVSRTVLAALRHAPGGIGFVAGVLALAAAVASPTLVLLETPLLAERSLR